MSDLDELGSPNCLNDLVPMEPDATSARSRPDGAPLVVGSAYWRGPVCGLAALY